GRMATHTNTTIFSTPNGLQDSVHAKSPANLLAASQSQTPTRRRRLTRTPRSTKPIEPYKNCYAHEVLELRLPWKCLPPSKTQIRFSTVHSAWIAASRAAIS